MIFKYKVIDDKGQEREGAIDAISQDVAIISLQGRGFVVSSITSADKTSFLSRIITILNPVKSKEIVILSRQIATLFDAQVSALRVFRLLAGESESPILRTSLSQVADDLQGGSSISKALARHPKIFSPFYTNMVRAGEESGKLDQIFGYLADYLERTHKVSSKARNALIYPAFIVFTFVVVMILMFTMVIPRVSSILLEAGQEIPIYTKIVMGVSSILVNYGVFLLILLVVGTFFLVRFARTVGGNRYFSNLQLTIPYIGGLYKKLYLARISENMNTMLSSGISMVNALEITSTVIDNNKYKEILKKSVESVKAGSSVSESLSGHSEVPNIMVQMIKVGEETGKIGEVLKTLAGFYAREVDTAVDTLVNLIEPVMIVFLGFSVGLILTSVLVPIYNISSAV
jgi:type IV pilus assembly protein PilC